MPPTLEHLLICEDIRHELGNKLTLVGVLGNNIVLPPETKFPSRLSQLCVFMRWRHATGMEKVFVAVAYKGDEFFKTEQPTILPKPGIPEDYSQLSFHFPGFPLKGLGEYQIRVYLDDPHQLSNEYAFLVSPEEKPKAG